MSSHTIKVAFGAAMVGPSRPFHDETTTNEALDVLTKHNVTILDTAQLYEGSEEMLGKVKAGERFTIDTKAMGGFNPGSYKDSVEHARESLRKLGVKQVDIFYLHAPEKAAPLDEILSRINEIHKAGTFKRFGLSNYEVADVQKVYDHCQSKGYVLPTVYQGNYSPIARKQEELLFPTLRKLGIAFYAYSPLAGGFLTKTKEQIVDGKDAGRFTQGHPIADMYRGMYAKPAYLEALEKWDAIAKEEGISKAELAYRWVASNSPLKRANGDAIIVGASSINQLDQTLAGLDKGPLSQKACKGIDDIWKTIEHEAPLDNYNSSNFGRS